MKIAVPVKSNNEIDDHFGHCEAFKIFEISENNTIKDIENVPSPQGCGCKSNIASVLAAKGVNTMLAGGIGMGAINVLANSGINVIKGCAGNAEALVKQYAAGELKDSGSTCRHHHGNGEHQCSH